MRRFAPWLAILCAGIVAALVLFLPGRVDRERYHLPLVRLVPPQVEAKTTVLVVGDSLSIPLGEQLERYLGALSAEVRVERLGKESSGLARPDFFDWEQALQQLVDHCAPDMVVVVLGTNDNKVLKGNGRLLAFGTPEWIEEYSERLRRFYAICERSNPAMHMFWVGCPIMGPPALRTDVAFINATAAEWCVEEASCEFVDTWETLTDVDGNYAQCLPDAETGGCAPVRTRDGVHLTAYGSALIAGVILDAMMAYYPFS